MTDFRALCAELVDWAKLLIEVPDPPVTRSADELSDLLARARAALAQPEPQGPTDRELLYWASHYGIDYVDAHRSSVLDGEKAPVRSDELCVFARTILQCWGR